jgi:ABC-type antimicrobial peptide transport system permease subunit
MTFLGGLLGAVVGFAIGILFTEVLFPAKVESWPDLVPVVLFVLGWLAGSGVVRRMRERHTRPAGPA